MGSVCENVCRFLFSLLIWDPCQLAHYHHQRGINHFFSNFKLADGMHKKRKGKSGFFSFDSCLGAGVCHSTIVCWLYIPNYLCENV